MAIYQPYCQSITNGAPRCHWQPDQKFYNQVLMSFT